MLKDRISLRRTVYYDEETDEFCQCVGDFWKTCSLRAANDLSCVEAIVSLTPIEREDNEADLAHDAVRSLDVSLHHLRDSLRGLSEKMKI